MIDARALIGRVHVEPLDRSILAGLAPKAADSPAESEGDAVVSSPQRLDLGVIPVFADERPLTGLAAFLDWRASGKLSALVRRRWWRGDVGECVMVPAGRTLPVRRIVLFGLGPSAQFDRARAEEAAATLVDVVAGLSPEAVLLAMPGKAQERAVVEAMFEAALGRLCTRAAERDPAAEPRGDAAEGSDALEHEPETTEPETDEPETNEDGGVRADAAAAGPEHGGGGATGHHAPDDGDRSTSGTTEFRTVDWETTCTWWVIADPRHVARLRRVLEGPPRAAGSAG